MLRAVEWSALRGCLKANASRGVKFLVALIYGFGVLFFEGLEKINLTMS